MKIAYCLDHVSKQLLSNYPSQNVILFREKQCKRFVVLVPKISYYVTYDVDFDMIRLSKATVPLLSLIAWSTGSLTEVSRARWITNVPVL